MELIILKNVFLKIFSGVMFLIHVEVLSINRILLYISMGEDYRINLNIDKENEQCEIFFKLHLHAFQPAQSILKRSSNLH